MMTVMMMGIWWSRGTDCADGTDMILGMDNVKARLPKPSIQRVLIPLNPFSKTIMLQR